MANLVWRERQKGTFLDCGKKTPPVSENQA